MVVLEEGIRAALVVMDTFESERGAVAGLAGLTLSPDITGADAASAREIISKATSVEQYQPTQSAYEGYTATIRSATRTLATQEITAFKTAYDAYGDFKQYFSPSINTAYTNSGTIVIGDKTAAEARTLVESYRDFKTQVAAEANPTTGEMFSRSRVVITERIEAYVAKVAQVAPISGGVLLNTTGTVAQVGAQTTYDRRKIAEATSVAVLELYMDMYETRETALLAAMRIHALAVLDDGFTKLYDTVEEKGLQDLVVQSVKDAGAAEATDRALMESTDDFAELLQLTQKYVTLVAESPLAIKRAEANQTLLQVKTLLTTIDAQNTGVDFSDTIPSLNTVNTTLANIPNINSISLLQLTVNQYTTVYGAVLTQYLAYARIIMGDFTAFYKAAQKESITTIFPTSVQEAFVSVEGDIASLDTKTAATADVEAVGAMINKYEKAYKDGEVAVKANATQIKVITKRNAMLLTITTFTNNLTTARSITALTTELTALDSTVIADIATVNATPLPADAVLRQLQKTYTERNATVTTAVAKALQDSVVAFTKALTSAKAKKATLPNRVRLASGTLLSNLAKVQGGKLTVLEMRDMYVNYTELTALLTGSLPSSADVTVARAEVKEMIQSFKTLLGNVGSMSVSFSTAVTNAKPDADMTAANAATTMSALTPLRVKYMQLLYEVSTKVDEARQAAAAALTAKKAEALAAIGQFESKLATAIAAGLDINEYPQLKKARTDITTNKGILADSQTTLETATAVLTTYTDALATLATNETLSAADPARDAQVEATLLAINRFTRVYQANLLVASLFSATLRDSLLYLPSDIAAAQAIASSMADLKTIVKKYDALTRTLYDELTVIKQDMITATVTAIRTFSTGINRLDSSALELLATNGIRVDTSMINTDLETLVNPAIPLEIITEKQTRYRDYTQAVTALIPTFNRPVKVSAAKKAAALKVLFDLNELYMKNMGVRDAMAPVLRTRIQQISAKQSVVESPSATPEDIQIIIEDYTDALEDLKSLVIGRPPTQASIDSNLRTIIDAFIVAFNKADIYKLERNDFNYIQLLVRNQTNAFVTQNVGKAVEAYTRGITILQRMPVVTAQGGIMNVKYNELLETMNALLDEWPLRNLGRAIPNDRLFLGSLKSNVNSYKELYRFRAPNMRNYDSLVDGLVEQYRQGLRLLRSYPLKTATR